MRSTRVVLCYQRLAVRAREGDCLTAYFTTDPVFDSALTIAPFRITYNYSMTYDLAPSDVGGCFELTNPRRAVPLLALEDKACPTICILDALRRRGWRAMQGLMIHEERSALRYDERNVQRQKSYLQCCLAIEDVTRVQASFRSDQPIGYYQLLLKGQAVEANLGAARYRDMLKALGNEEHVFEFAIGDVEGSLAPPVADEDLFDMNVESAAAVAPAFVPAAVPLVVPAGVPPSEMRSPRSRSRSGPRAAAAGSDDPLGSEEALFDVAVPGGGSSTIRHGAVQVPDGPLCKLETWSPVGRAEYANWTAVCTFHGRSCKKTRGAKFCERFGRVEPVAFLAAWNALGEELSEEEHRKRGTKPTEEKVAEWVARLGHGFLGAE